MAPSIRLATPADRGALFDICLRTAASGLDASALYSDPRYPGVVWSVPYLDLSPEHAFVLADGADVLGYCVGTGDSRAFHDRLERSWWPLWRTEFSGRKPVAAFDDKVLGYVANPPALDAAVVAAFPAHLHINLLPPAQSGGWGRRLIEAQLASHRDRGTPGLHLGVSPDNFRAMSFYEHMGFRRLPEAPGVIYAIDLA